MLQKFKFWILIGVVFCNIGCDQVSKGMARRELGSDEVVEVVKNHVTLMRTENRGAFLSLGFSLPGFWHDLLLLYLPLLVLIAGGFYVLRHRNQSAWFLTGAGFMIGGGAGNLADRFLYGSVTDFLHLQAGSLQTGIFNMADVSIMTGLAMILISMAMQKQRNINQVRDSEPSAF